MLFWAPEQAAVAQSIAAQLAHPERQCVGFVGDGGFTMLMG